jgi:hypothetical protein
MQRGGMLWFVSPYELEVRRSADRWQVGAHVYQPQPRLDL